MFVFWKCWHFIHDYDCVSRLGGQARWVSFNCYEHSAPRGCFKRYATLTCIPPHGGGSKLSFEGGCCLMEPSLPRQCPTPWAIVFVNYCLGIWIQIYWYFFLYFINFVLPFSCVFNFVFGFYITYKWQNQVSHISYRRIAINLTIAISLLKFRTYYEFHIGFAQQCDFDDVPIF